MNSSWHTPPELAALYGVNERKIGEWIRAGELVAVNVAAKTSSRPRWRISPAAKQAFEERRQYRQPDRPIRKRRATTGVKQFF